MATFFKMEAANLFVGEDAEGKHLTLMGLALPELSYASQDHNPGGGFVGMGFNTHIEKLEAGFNLKGEDPDLMGEFGIGINRRKIFTALGAVRNERTGDVVEVKALIEGMLGKIAPDEFQLGDLRGYEYGINSISSYTVSFDGAERWYWNYWTNTLRVNGGDARGDVNSILQING